MLHQLLKILVASGEWLFYYVIVRGVIIRGMSNYASNTLTPYFHKTARQVAIWDHYMFRASKMGHQVRSVRACRDGNCVLFAGKT